MTDATTDRAAEKLPAPHEQLQRDINRTILALLEFGSFEPKAKHAQAAQIGTTLIYKRMIELGYHQDGLDV